jgi:hypothetical protein
MSDLCGGVAEGVDLPPHPGQRLLPERLGNEAVAHRRLTSKREHSTQSCCRKASQFEGGFCAYTSKLSA